MPKICYMQLALLLLFPSSVLHASTANIKSFIALERDLVHISLEAILNELILINIEPQSTALKYHYDATEFLQTYIQKLAWLKITSIDDLKSLSRHQALPDKLIRLLDLIQYKIKALLEHTIKILKIRNLKILGDSKRLQEVMQQS